MGEWKTTVEHDGHPAAFVNSREAELAASNELLKNELKIIQASQPKSIYGHLWNIIFVTWGIIVTGMVIIFLADRLGVG